MHDLIIRGATLYDGTGAAGRCADVAVAGGRIAAVGRVKEGARRSLDAGGLALMPGIVDVHTHYDAQATWDPTLSPSPSLGVTTAVIGNCGFGIAPCPAPMRETMVRNLSVVEGMDLEALLAGTRWEFESFAEYLAQLRRAKPYANVAVLAQHSTIRTAVMGEEASTRSAATRRRNRAECARWCARRSMPARSASPRRSRPTTAVRAGGRCPRPSRPITS